MENHLRLIKNISTGLIFGFLNWTIPANACPMPIRYFTQTANLERVMSSEPYKVAAGQLIEQDRNLRLVGISFGTNVTFEFSNGCTLVGKIVNHPMTMPGECPRFDRVDISANCN